MAWVVQTMAETGRPKGDSVERSDKQEGLAREAWSLLFKVMSDQMRHFPLLAAEFELSPVQTHVLRALGESAQPMSALAGQLGCDASNVTGLVDRLEVRGLVERQSAPHDRRVKLLALTEEGRRVRERFLARLMEPPPAVSALSVQDLRALRDVMQHALEHMERLKAEPPPADAQSSKKV
jgi:DNA-binding MarR family transcriptional regulator